MRIAVLLTNDDTSAFAAHFPNDGQKVVQLLQPLRPSWTFEVVPVKDGVLPASAQAFDGYVITGSPASVNDDSLPWVGQLLGFIREVHAARQPLIGLCFGHQAVARALGGQVVRNAAGWGLGTAATHWAQPRAWMHPPRAATTLMAALLVHDLRNPSAAARPSTPLDNPMDLFAQAAADYCLRQRSVSVTRIDQGIRAFVHAGDEVSMDTLLQREISLDQAGDQLLECLLRTANGRLTAAEALGHREFVLTRLFESA